MTDHHVRAKGPLPLISTGVPINELPVDEPKVENGPKIISIRDLQAFSSAAMTKQMEASWGVFTAIRTGTDKENSRIYLYKADPAEDGVVRVNRGGTQNAANFSLGVPLGKVNLRPTSGYQWDIIPKMITTSDETTVFVLDLKERTPVPRNLKEEEEQATAAATAAATGETAKEEPTKAKEEPSKATAAGTQRPSAPRVSATRAKELEELIDARENELHKLYEELYGPAE